MYPNLKAEMARKSITVKRLAEMIGVKYSRLYPKLNKDIPFSLAVKIKQTLDLEMPLEELFWREK